ncbi:MAG: hypothetical protein ACFFAU_17265 [Candidatus Hodarchaeota archaeon]
MDKSNFIETIKSITVVLFSFVFIVSIENIIYPETQTGILKNPLNLIRNLPLIMLSYFFLKEMLLLLSKKTANLELFWVKNGIGFIQDSFAWIAIFETCSLNKIQKAELEQLFHLKSFSLELDVKNSCARVFLYAKSNDELREIIKKSKPILDVILPDLKTLPVVEASNLFDKYSLEKIGNNYFLKNKNQFFILNFESVKANSFSYTDKIVFCFFTKTKNKKKKDTIHSQWYSFKNLNQNSFFNSLSKILINNQEKNLQSFWKRSNLERIQIRYQLGEQEKLSFQEGIAQFEKGLSILLSQTEPDIILEKELKRSMENDNMENVLRKKNSVNKKIQNIIQTSITNYEDINGLHKEFPFETIKTNQICFELCNIAANRDFTNREKLVKCTRRADFCQRLLKNENFLSIIENILKQNHEGERIHLTTELRRHLSYQQLICILANLTQSEQFSTVNQELIGMIHVLFKLKYEALEDSNVEINSIFSSVTKEKNREKVFPSLAFN